jgi:hypothetical protein
VSVREEKPERTPAGFPERRRIRYVTWDQEIRIVWLLVGFITVLAIGCAIGLWWSWQNSRANREQSANAVERSCLARGELRLTIADAIDGIRLSAIGSSADADPREFTARQRRFIAATQPPVDKLIRDAAGDPSYRTDPPGPVPPSVSVEVRQLVRERCAAQAESFRRTRVPPRPE